MTTSKSIILLGTLLSIILRCKIDCYPPRHSSRAIISRLLPSNSTGNHLNPLIQNDQPLVYNSMNMIIDLRELDEPATTFDCRSCRGYCTYIKSTFSNPSTSQATLNYTWNFAAESDRISIQDQSHFCRNHIQAFSKHETRDTRHWNLLVLSKENQIPFQFKENRQVFFKYASIIDSNDQQDPHIHIHLSNHFNISFLSVKVLKSRLFPVNIVSSTYPLVEDNHEFIEFSAPSNKQVPNAEIELILQAWEKGYTVNPHSGEIDIHEEVVDEVARSNQQTKPNIIDNSVEEMTRLKRELTEQQKQGINSQTTLEKDHGKKQLVDDSYLTENEDQEKEDISQDNQSRMNESENVKKQECSRYCFLHRFLSIPRYFIFVSSSFFYYCVTIVPMISIGVIILVQFRTHFFVQSLKLKVDRIETERKSANNPNLQNSEIFPNHQNFFREIKESQLRIRLKLEFPSLSLNEIEQYLKKSKDLDEDKVIQLIRDDFISSFDSICSDHNIIENALNRAKWRKSEAQLELLQTRSFKVKTCNAFDQFLKDNFSKERESVKAKDQVIVAHEDHIRSLHTQVQHLEERMKEKKELVKLLIDQNSLLCESLVGK